MTHCVVINVDGEPVRLQLAVPEKDLTEEDLEAIKELVRFVRNKSEAQALQPKDDIDAVARLRKRKIKIVRSKEK